MNDISMAALVAPKSVAPDKNQEDQELPFRNWVLVMDVMPLEAGDAAGEVVIDEL